MTSQAARSPPRRSAASAFVEDVHQRTTRVEEEEMQLKRKLVPRLAKRAYHLEDDNNWRQDWVQYQKNTHPVFGLCMYHRFHPIRLPQRVIMLVGSIAFGFALTNCVYLGFVGSEQAGQPVNFVYDVTGKFAEYQQQYTNIELQQSMVFLVTVGSFLHSTFDLGIWYLMGCMCFRPGGRCQGKGKKAQLCQNFGIYVAVVAVIGTVVAATSVAAFRLNNEIQTEDASEAEQFTEDQLEGNETASHFSFLIGYCLELVFTYFVFYFLTSTLAFSGILGCGRIPVIGGRPYEVWRAKNSKDEPLVDDLDAYRHLYAYL
ncbi:hypothetical protein ACHAXT_007749 [Thalassiosira profunda]